MLNMFARACCVLVLSGDFMIAGTYAEKCRYPFKKIGDGCYFINRQKETADRAFALCLRRGAYLATFETLEEVMLMKYELQQMHKGIHFNIGGRNINRYIPGGDWRWIKHGELIKMKYKAFGAGQPNGNNSDAQDCLIFHAGDSHTIHDCYCNSYPFGYICEK